MKYIYFTHLGYLSTPRLIVIVYYLLLPSSSILGSKLMFVLMMGFVTRFNGSVFRCALQVERRIDLVYGGGSVGLMGLVSQAVHDGGRHVLGFVPLSLSVS